MAIIKMSQMRKLGVPAVIAPPDRHLPPPPQTKKPAIAPPAITRAKLKEQADAILAQDKKQRGAKEKYSLDSDVLYYAAKPVPLGDKAQLEINVMSYEGGPRKVQLIKSGITKDWHSTSIPRLDAQEAKALLDSLLEALAWMEAN